MLTRIPNRQAYLEFTSQQAATAAKHKIDAFGDGQQYVKKHTVTYSNPNVNPFRTLPKDAPARAGKESQGSRVPSAGYSNERGGQGGNFGGANFRGRTVGYNSRGNMQNMNGNNFNRNFSGPAMGNMGGNFNSPMGGFPAGQMGGQFGGFNNRGGMMGGMRGGPNSMRGGRGGMNNNMMGGMPMGGMPMGGMPGGMGGMPMNMGQMGGGMPGMIPPCPIPISLSQCSVATMGPKEIKLSKFHSRNILCITCSIPHTQADRALLGAGGFGGMQPHFNPAFFQQNQAAGGDWQNPHGAKRPRPE